MPDLLYALLAILAAGAVAPLLARASERKIRADVADYRSRRGA
jgi:hypothetical protein